MHVTVCVINLFINMQIGKKTQPLCNSAVAVQAYAVELEVPLTFPDITCRCKSRGQWIYRDIYAITGVLCVCMFAV